ncbi:gap junction protein alpha 10 b [Scomber scombrus]|uniref:Gap junction protein alpha 10 b n=1 Tax=Scomber scombrus TaxID=13677 RepID=A0AAV1PUH9_SCOSC
MVQQVCVLTNSSPRRSMQLTQMTCSVVSDAPGEPLNSSNQQAMQQLGAVERRYTLDNRKSCSSDESNGPHGSGQPQYAGPRPTLMAGHMEIPAALRNPQRKQSRVSICKELSDRSDSPESDHYPTARKCSFMSRGMSEGMLATPSDSADSQSGTDAEAQHLTQGESPVMTPPPPAGGRRMSMSMILELSSIMKKCQRVGNPIASSEPLQCIKVSAVWELVEIDLTGPLPKTKDGFEYILTATDYFFQMGRGIPIADQNRSRSGMPYLFTHLQTWLSQKNPFGSGKGICKSSAAQTDK